MKTQSFFNENGSRGWCSRTARRSQDREDVRSNLAALRVPSHVRLDDDFLPPVQRGSGSRRSLGKFQQHNGVVVVENPTSRASPSHKLKKRINGTAGEVVPNCVLKRGASTPHFIEGGAQPHGGGGAAASWAAPFLFPLQSPSRGGLQIGGPFTHAFKGVLLVQLNEIEPFFFFYFSIFQLH